MHILHSPRWGEDFEPSAIQLVPKGWFRCRVQTAGYGIGPGTAGVVITGPYSTGFKMSFHRRVSGLSNVSHLKVNRPLLLLLLRGGLLCFTHFRFYCDPWQFSQHTLMCADLLYVECWSALVAGQLWVHPYAFVVALEVQDSRWVIVTHTLTQDMQWNEKGRCPAECANE